MKNTKKIPQASQEIYLQLMYTLKKCCPFQSQHHTIVEVGGTFRDHLVSFLARPPKAGLPRTIWRWLWNISKEGDCTTSMGNLCPQCLVTPALLMFRKHPRVSACAHCLCSCHWAPLKRVGLHPLWALPPGIDLHWCHFPWAFFSPGQTVPGLSS